MLVVLFWSLTKKAHPKMYFPFRSIHSIHLTLLDSIPIHSVLIFFQFKFTHFLDQFQLK